MIVLGSAQGLVIYVALWMTPFKSYGSKTWVGFLGWTHLVCVFVVCGWTEKEDTWSLQRQGGLRSCDKPFYHFLCICVFLLVLHYVLCSDEFIHELTCCGITKVLPGNRQAIRWSWDPWNTLDVLLQKDKKVLQLMRTGNWQTKLWDVFFIFSRIEFVLFLALFR